MFDDHEMVGVTSLDLKNLKVISALGRGAKGVVFLVETESGESIALKAILRASIEKKNKYENIVSDSDDESEYKRIFFERRVLSSLQHPLLPKLRGVVSTEKIVGYGIDYCSGGDLNTLRKKQTEKMFSDDIIRFYAAEMVLALEYLHGLGIVYRDLKPENVMIQENGHLMLIDFDLSTELSPKTPKKHSINEAGRKSQPTTTAITKKTKKNKKKSKLFQFYKCCNSGISPDDLVHPVKYGGDSVTSESDSVEKSNSFVGTEEYVAPEIIIGNGHDFAVDWWCLGVMLYEMLYGTTPFRGSNRKETFTWILSKEPKLTGEQTPLRDLIKKLLEKDPKKRISVEEIKRHCFFKDVDWDFILEMPRPPFIPDVEGDTNDNKEIDVENFVQEVFENKVNNNEKIEEKEENNNNNNNNGEEGKNNGGWVQGLNHPTQAQNEFFLVF